MPRRTFSEELWKALGDGVADIREKFEESVWGRTVTDRAETPHWPEAREAQPEASDHGHDRAADMDMDR